MLPGTEQNCYFRMPIMKCANFKAYLLEHSWQFIYFKDCPYRTRCGTKPVGEAVTTFKVLRDALTVIRVVVLL